MADLLTMTPQGLYCARGGFHVDPWQPVAHAVLTHAHADHAREGSAAYLCSGPGLPVVRHRLPGAVIEAWQYGERHRMGDVQLSFHPAGHVLGSAQLRIEADGEVWVVSGDYKRAPDPTCAPFEPLRADVFLTEATFGLPVFRWEPTESVIEDLLGWWETNREAARASLVFCHVLGKSQRLLAELALRTDRRVFAHGAIAGMCDVYRDAGVRLLPVDRVADTTRGKDFAGELVLAPITARGTPWMRRFGDAAVALVSGFMRVRGERRRRSVDRGFALSDHADWPALVGTIRETGAQRVLVTHGYAVPLAQRLCELGIQAEALETPYGRDQEEVVTGESPR
ncbi:MAG TPA: ligase-associated DNA damage response exonuclease [Myxococcaceae bacterium]|nr:ligase-associated DNA damage response exonuclease [Myxococcaceae bacterium]